MNQEVISKALLAIGFELDTDELEGFIVTKSGSRWSYWHEECFVCETLQEVQALLSELESSLTGETWM